MIWRAALAVCLTAVLSLFAPSAPHAQFNGCPAGFCSPPAKSSPPPSYTGPGDVVSGALEGWSFDCYNSAYTGNVADIWDSATGSATETLLTCSSGGVVNQIINALSVTCAVACSVKTLYDQIGTACSGPCDMTQATNANRPTLVNGTVLSMQCGTNKYLAATSLTSQAQPYTVSSVFERTGATSAYNLIYANGGGGVYVALSPSANTFVGYAGTGEVSATANDNAIHAVQAVFNGVSSVFNIDGTETTGNPGAAPAVSDQQLCRFGADGDYLNGNEWETWVYPLGFSSGQRSAMNSNQHSRLGF